MIRKKSIIFICFFVVFTSFARDLCDGTVTKQLKAEVKVEEGLPEAVQYQAVSIANRISNENVWTKPTSIKRLMDFTLRYDFVKTNRRLSLFTSGKGRLISYAHWHAGKKEFWCAND